MNAIRPFRPDDRAAVTDIRNADLPPHQRGTVREWEERDARMTGGEVFLRLCVGEPSPLAFLEVEDAGTFPGAQPGVCWMTLHVARNCRRQGLGSALYARALAFADERAARRLRTSFPERSGDEPALSFLSRRGFVEFERERPSYLDLAAYDPAPLASAVARAEALGIRLVAYADLPDTDENRHKLWRLDADLERDMPRNDTEPYEDVPFAQYVKQWTRPEWEPRAVILAVTPDGEWAGVTQLMFQQGTGVAWTNVTGVKREWRGRGIATALKARVMEAALARNCRIITTENDISNGPMIAINTKMGFVPDAPWLVYDKTLREG